MAGRPSKYTPELADKICETIATSSKSMKTICKENGVGVSNVLRWLTEIEEFKDKYARAKEMQADYLVEEMLDIADDGTNDTKKVRDKNGKEIEVEDTEWTRRSVLRVDTRKWIASKLKPKKYGDKMENTNINIEQPLFPDVPKDNSNQ